MPSKTSAMEDIHILMTALPAYGHVRPLKAVATSLVQHGFPVTFISGTGMKERIESTGAEFVPLSGRADFDMDNLAGAFPEREAIPKGPAVAIWDMENIFYAGIPDQEKTISKVLARPELQSKRVVIVGDSGFLGTLPMLLGAPGRRVPVINMGHFPLMQLSVDCAPFGLGLPSQGREKNIALNEQVTQMFTQVIDTALRLLKPYGCMKSLPSAFPVDPLVLCPDLYLQQCVPALEPPRSDLPEHVRFIGAILGSNDRRPEPEWFQSFVVEDKSKPLVVVTSGSLPTVTAEELIIPTIEACKDLPVRLIVCTVHAELPEGFKVPANVRVARWVAFEGLFPHADIVVTSAGYGGITQAFAAGLPLVCAGVTEDKVETSARAEMTGAAINLRTGVPSVEQVREALEKILKDPVYKQKAIELKEDYAKYNAFESVLEAVEEMADKFYPSSNGHIKN